MNALVPMEQFRLTFAERPFGTIKVYGVATGCTIAEMLADRDDLPPGFDEHGTVRINDIDVPREMWSVVRPKADRPDRPVVVTLHCSLRGGKWLKTALTIAVLVAAVAVSAGALAPLGATLGIGLGAGSVGAAVAGAAIAIGGSLAIAALSPPPTMLDAVGTNSAAAAAGIAGAGNGAGGSLSTASLTSNVLARGRPLPYSVGFNRVFPPAICEPLIDLNNEEEIAECVYGFAGPHSFSEILIGNTPIEDIVEVQSEIFNGTAATPPFQGTLVQRHGATDNINVECSIHMVSPTVPGGATALESPLFTQGNPNADVPLPRRYMGRQAPDEIWMTLVFGQGLFYVNDTNKPVCAPFRFRMRLKGSLVWVNLPEIHFSSSKVKPMQQIVRFIWGNPPPAAAFPPPGADGAIRAYKLVLGQRAAVGVVTSGWAADSTFSAGPGNDVYSSVNNHTTSNVLNVRLGIDGVSFYLPSYPKGEWEVEVTQGAAFRNELFNEITYVMSAAVPEIYDFFLYFFSTTGKFSQVFDLSGTRYKATIPRVANVWNQAPVQAKLGAQIAIKVKSRQLDRLSCIASALIPDWNGSSWTGSVATANPAAHFRNVLTGALNVNPLPTAVLDDAQLVAWRARCLAKGYTANCVLEGQSVMDCLNLIAAAGYARPRLSDKWGVVQDYDRSAEAPVQVFSARNMKGFAFQKGFPRRPDALRISFRDASENYNTRQIEVEDPDASSINSFEEISYDSLTSEAAAVTRALFDIEQSKLRMTFWTGEVSIDSLVATRGDLVGINHDIVDNVHGSARIKTINRSGGRITSIVLDGTVPGPGSGNLGIAVRLLNGAGWWVQTTNITSATTETATITFSGSGPLDPGANLAVDCLLLAGKSGQEYKRMIVHSISPADDLMARVTFVDEAPGLWT